MTCLPSIAFSDGRGPVMITPPGLSRQISVFRLPKPSPPNNPITDNFPPQVTCAPLQPLIRHRPLARRSHMRSILRQYPTAIPWLRLRPSRTTGRHLLIRN